MRGISSEELINFNPWDYANQQDLLNAILKKCHELNQWMPIETAPKDTSVMLCCGVAKYGTQLIYCGRYRAGTMGEPQEHEIAWRCDSSGRFSNPTHWMPLPDNPK